MSPMLMRAGLLIDIDGFSFGTFFLFVCCLHKLSISLGFVMFRGNIDCQLSWMDIMDFIGSVSICHRIGM